MTQLRPAPKHYLVRVLVGLDLFVNGLLGGNPYESMSSSLYNRMVRGERWACILCKLLDRVIEKDHCEKSDMRMDHA